MLISYFWQYIFLQDVTIGRNWVKGTQNFSWFYFLQPHVNMIISKSKLKTNEQTIQAFWALSLSLNDDVGPVVANVLCVKGFFN